MSVPSSGTLTFLFTDIESSTRKWERDAPAMSKALKRHDEILRSGIESRRGYVFKTVGDAFCAAFADPLDALMASTEIQRALAAESWDITGGIVVRMCLHSGPSEERDGDYFGQTLNRTARILALAHGGQILASLAFTELVADRLSADFQLLSLGAHRLKDLSRPESLAQIKAPGLKEDFPPLRSLDAQPNNLPMQLTSFLGRESELMALREAIEGGCRLLTLLGPGGEGKTRLALQAAAELLARYPAGVWFVDLSSCRNAEETAKTINRTLGIRDRPDSEDLPDLVEHIGGRAILLVLDNLEQDIDAAPYIGRIISEIPSLVLLATSREPLRLSWERILYLSPLAVPPREGTALPESLGQYASVALFIDRAVLANPSFKVTNRNAPALAELCARLDGIPLAVELAAARVRALTVEDILKRLGSDYSLIDSKSPDRNARHRTLGSVVAWSYDLLEEDERRAFRAFGVFTGSFSLSSAEAVLAAVGIEGPRAIELLTSLVEKCMVVHNNELSRYSLYEILKRFARQAAGEAGDAAACLAAHDRHCLAIAEEARLCGIARTGELEALRTLDADYRDLVAALDGFARVGDADARLGIAAGIADYWELRGAFREGSERIAAALAAAGEGADPALRVAALKGLAGLKVRLGDRIEALELIGHARALCGPEDGEMVAELDAREGHILGHLERLEEAELALRRSLASGPMKAFTRAYAEYGLGLTARLAGRRAEAKALLKHASVIFESIGELRISAQTGIDLGIVHIMEGDRAAARRAFEACLERFERFGDRHGICAVTNNLAEMAFEEERWEDSLAAYSSVEIQARAGGILRFIALGLSGAARSLARLGRGEEALAKADDARNLAPADRYPLEARDALVAVALAKEALGDCRAALDVLREVEGMPSGDATDQKRIALLRERLIACEKAQAPISKHSGNPEKSRARRGG